MSNTRGQWSEKNASHISRLEIGSPKDSTRSNMWPYLWVGSMLGEAEGIKQTKNSQTWGCFNYPNDRCQAGVSRAQEGLAVDMVESSRSKMGFFSNMCKGCLHSHQ